MKKLNELVASVINVSVAELTPQSGPENLSSWDSLAHVGIISAVEQTYNLQFSMPEMLSIKTLGDLGNLLEKHGVTLNDGPIG